MSEIGFLEEYTTDGRRYFKGMIHTLGHDLNVRFVPIPPPEESEGRGAPNPNHPNYYIFALDIYGKEVKVGAAWLKVPKSSLSKIPEFLSIMIDDPTLSAPLNAAAFPQADYRWSVTWRRRQTAA